MPGNVPRWQLGPSNEGRAAGRRKGARDRAAATSDSMASRGGFLGHLLWLVLLQPLLGGVPGGCRQRLQAASERAGRCLGLDLGRAELLGKRAWRDGGQGGKGRQGCAPTSSYLTGFPQVRVTAPARVLL